MDFVKTNAFGDKTDHTQLEEFLNDEADNIIKKTDINSFNESAISQMNIKLVSEDIQLLVTTDPITKKKVEHYIIGIVKLDNVFYAGIFTSNEQGKSKRRVERATVDAHYNVTNLYFIVDLQEWALISNYFNSRNLFEARRVMDWVISYAYSLNDPALKNKIESAQWFKVANQTAKRRYEKELTAEEIISKLPKHQDIVRYGHPKNHGFKPIIQRNK